LAGEARRPRPIQWSASGARRPEQPDPLVPGTAWSCG
jgi:hypothetical protein